MADPKATFKTNRGDIVINLFPNHAPETVDNFVGLAEGTKDYRDDAGRSGEQFYDGLGFHRVIDGFMIQGGCPSAPAPAARATRSRTRSTPSCVFDKPYLLAMANAGPGTNGSQFFITVGADPVAEPQAHDLRRGGRPGQPRRRRRDRHHPDRREGPPAEPVVIESVDIERDAGDHHRRSA